MDPDLLQDTAKLVSRNWPLDELEVTEPELFYQQLKQRLASAVQELLLNDMDHLVNLMYKVDIKEEDFHGAMSQANSHAIAESVADLVLQRMMQKARTRKQYKEMRNQ